MNLYLIAKIICQKLDYVILKPYLAPSFSKLETCKVFEGDVFIREEGTFCELQSDFYLE